MWLEEVWDFTEWIAGASAPPLAILGAVGYVFREKWKQILAGSLAKELEGLKHQLTIVQKDHEAAASSALEAVKHDFQVNLESYKTSLIAQAEAVKAKMDVKKSVANKFAELQFESLMALDESMMVAWDTVRTFSAYPPHLRDPNQLPQAMADFEAFVSKASRAEIFLTTSQSMQIHKVRGHLVEMLSSVGPGAQAIPFDDSAGVHALGTFIEAKNLVQGLIRNLVALPA